MHAGVGGEGEPEETDGDEDRADLALEEARLGRRVAVVGFAVLAEALVPVRLREEGEDLGGGESRVGAVYGRYIPAQCQCRGS